MASFRTFVVANPRAGNGAVEREWDQIERKLRVQLDELDFAFTEGPNHGTLLAREALRAGWEMVVAIGGDGTFNEIVNGFFEKPDGPAEFAIDESGLMARTGGEAKPIREDAVMGLLPMGTGGDFRRSVGIMGDLDESIGRLGGDQTRPCDVGQISFVDHDGKIASRYFINIASAGLSGDVDRVVNETWKGFGGKAAFQIGSVRAWLGWKNVELKVVLDGVDEVTEKFTTLVVANGEYFGGGMWVAPGAAIDDGLFQVVFTGDMPRVESLQWMGKVYKGQHLELEHVYRKDATTVSVMPGPSAGRPVLLDVDGEQPGRLPALFETHATPIRIKV